MLVNTVTNVGMILATERREEKALIRWMLEKVMSLMTTKL
jgi:hypothetical protein